MGDLAYRRARHVVKEQKRVFDMVRAFEKKNLVQIGTILADGHKSLSTDYEVSLPVLDEMIEWLCRRPGVVGARLTGAGFGGSLICLAKARSIDTEILKREFLQEFSDRVPGAPDLWQLHPVNGAKYQPSFVV
jgi:galactokinase